MTKNKYRYWWKLNECTWTWSDKRFVLHIQMVTENWWNWDVLDTITKKYFSNNEFKTPLPKSKKEARQLAFEYYNKMKKEINDKSTTT